jgi:hypothetical protein
VCAGATAVRTTETDPNDTVARVHDLDAGAVGFKEGCEQILHHVFQLVLHPSSLTRARGEVEHPSLRSNSEILVLPRSHRGLASWSNPNAWRLVIRYRLRFLLQELELSGPLIVLGRSPNCQVTLDDPLVSRKHAAITIGAEGAEISDLGSRNGVRINGLLTRGPTRLAHNDRIRLGSQDLVFLLTDASIQEVLPSRPTGRIRQCRSCSRPFPGESHNCPHCGSTTEPPPSSPFEAVTDLMLEPDASWALRLLLDVVQKTLDTARAPEAERAFLRAQREVDTRLLEGRVVEVASLTRISAQAVELSRLTRTEERLAWVLRVHTQMGQLPDANVIEYIIGLDRTARNVLKPAVEHLLLAWKAAALSDDRKDYALRLQRLESWVGAAA